MNSGLELQNTVEIIYKSIEDVHAFISTLEEQIKVGLSISALEEQIKIGLTPAQSELKTFNGSSQKKSLR